MTFAAIGLGLDNETSWLRDVLSYNVLHNLMQDDLKNKNKSKSNNKNKKNKNNRKPQQ